MEQVFFTGINIEKVRHLEKISIPLDKEKRKHLILTGKNGSGKTSVLEAMVKYLENAVSSNGSSVEDIMQSYNFWTSEIQRISSLEDN